MISNKSGKLTREQVISIICDPTIKLDGEVKRDLTRGFIDCTLGTGFLGKYLYGVNVRTPEDLSNIQPYFASSKLESSLTPTLSLPYFTDEFGVREMFFYADLDSESKPISLSIHTLLFDAGIKHKKDKKSIEEWLMREGNFFTTNVKNLGIKSARAFMWLSSEDFFTGDSVEMQDYWTSNDINKKRNGQALSNILAISDDREFLQQNIISRRIDLVNFLILLKARHLFEQNLQRLCASEKSAKAAIMSRNMSHNLGSHVMAYLKQHLYSVQDMIKDNVLDQILEPGDTIDTILKDVDGWLERIQKKIQENSSSGEHIQEIALPFLVGLGKFISYLQERQDFIATIATDYSPYFSTVNFKDFIYDELNPDLRYKRHRDRSGMRPDNILLGNIAKSEGLARVTCPTDSKRDAMSDIILKFRSFDGNPVQDGTDQATHLEQMREIEVSLPGGVVGRQAFFSVIENIIRNAAKHGKWGDQAGDQKKDLELTFEIYPKVKSLSSDKPEVQGIPFYKVNKDSPLDDAFKYYSKDRKGVWAYNAQELNTFDFLRKYYSYAEGISELNVFSITDNMWFELVATPTTFDNYQDQPEVVEALYSLSSGRNLEGIRSALCQRYIDKEGRMINENKGIKEMRISAAWMRSLNDSITYNPFNEALQAKNIKNNYFDSSGNWIGVAPVLLARPVFDSEVTTSVRVGGKDFPIRAFAYNLQLLICLMKPKKVCIITNNSYSKEFKDRLNDYSWNIYSTAEYQDKNNKNRSYEFIIVDDRDNNDSSLEEFLNIRFISHSRTYKLSSLPKQVYRIVSDLVDKSFLSPEKIEEAEVELYRLLADYHMGETIRISDGTTYEKYEKPGSKFKHSELITVKDGDQTETVNSYDAGDSVRMCRFVYNKHLDTDKELNLFMKAQPTPLIDFFDKNDNPGHVTFAEGITGNNSTDRLVRNEPLTDKWVYAHLHAMKQRIAIFDERIFFKTFRVEEMDIIGCQDHVEPYVHVTSSNYRSIFNRVKTTIPKNLFTKLRSSNDKTQMVKDLDAFLYQEYISKSKTRMIADKGGFLFALKGVYIFNIIKSTNHLDIYGYAGDSFDGERHHSYVDKVGVIKLDSEENVCFEISEQFRNKFDRISIHQGLLDKIYETFGIKNCAQKKHYVTLAFYDAMSVLPPEKKDSNTSTKPTVYEYEEIIGKQKIRGYFLPHLMIHSGRSKPSATDMPQHQPFIQYAAIEHAVLDCKYSLVELMDFARYEHYED